MSKVRTELTLKEFAVISELRKVIHGEVEIHKVKGDIVRIFVKNSKNITEEDGVEAMRQSMSSIAFIGESSIIKEEEVSLVYGKEIDQNQSTQNLAR